MSTIEPRTPSGIRRRFPALQEREFRLFWMGQFVSRAGSEMQGTAINWQMYLLTGNPVALGMLGLVRFVPIVLLSLLGGALADAVSRRRLMLVTQSIMLLNAIALGWFTFTGKITPSIIYTLTAINAGAMAFDAPARQALVTNLVRREHLENAISINSAVFKVATMAGPVIAGFILDAGGIAFTYWLNAASFLAVIGALLRMRNCDNKERNREVSLSALREGLDFVRRTPVVMALMLLDCIATFFSSANTLLPIFAKDILHVGARGYGILCAAPAVGSFLAAGAMSLRQGVRRQGRVVLIAVAVHGLATLLFGLSKWFWVSCALLALANGADTVSAILRQTIRQLVTPDRLRGRVAAVNMVFVMGGPRLGELESGLLARVWGAPLSVVTGGIGCILTAMGIAWAYPAIRDYARKEEKEVGV